MKTNKILTGVVALSLTLSCAINVTAIENAENNTPEIYSTISRATTSKSKTSS